MTADLLHPGEIVECRIRLGVLGRPVLQVRRASERFRLYANGYAGMERVGEGPWRDARRSDALEAAALLHDLQVSREHCTGVANQYGTAAIPVDRATKADWHVWLAAAALRTVESIGTEGNPAIRLELIRVLADQVRHMEELAMRRSPPTAQGEVEQAL